MHQKKPCRSVPPKNEHATMKHRVDISFRHRSDHVKRCLEREIIFLSCVCSIRMYLICSLRGEDQLMSDCIGVFQRKSNSKPSEHEAMMPSSANLTFPLVQHLIQSHQLFPAKRTLNNSEQMHHSCPLICTSSSTVIENRNRLSIEYQHLSPLAPRLT